MPSDHASSKIAKETAIQINDITHVKFLKNPIKMWSLLAKLRSFRQNSHFLSSFPPTAHFFHTAFLFGSFLHRSILCLPYPHYLFLLTATVKETPSLWPTIPAQTTKRRLSHRWWLIVEIQMINNRLCMCEFKKQGLGVKEMIVRAKFQSRIKLTYDLHLQLAHSSYRVAPACVTVERYQCPFWRMYRIHTGTYIHVKTWF